MTKIIRAKRLLTNKELDYYNTLTPVKQKKYLETLFGELFQETEYVRERKH